MHTRIRFARFSWRPVLATACFGVLACGGGGETRTVVGPGGGGGGGGGGDAQKATLTVTVRPSTDDAAVFGALGWTNAVPGATVVAQRTGSATRVTATADASGVATFSDLVPGTYSVSALRTFTAADRAHLAAGDEDVDAAAGALSLTVSAPSAQATISASAGRRGTLVVSELYRDYPPDGAGSFYLYGNFLELYNNADTAVALADKVVVEGEPGWYDYSTYSCAQMEATTNDPDGIWARNLFAFPPGTPPLQPGHAIVLATDAIDHTQLIASGAYNLSGADLEFLGSSDVDNPTVPNMIPLGPGSGDTGYHHGLTWNQVWEVVALAKAVDVASLPHGYWHELDNQPMVRVPADKLIDVLTDREVLDSPLGAPCPEAVNTRFDRESVHASTDTDKLSLQRKVVATLPDGRKVLLRTKTSARDFEAAAPTPFAIP